MIITPLGIEGAWVAESPVRTDDRGSFHEWFKLSDIEKATKRKFDLEQANVSSSKKGTIRGIHYSLAAKGQAKWITCISGSIRDVVVDIRPKSKTFGKWIAIDLYGNSGKAVFCSEGLGHGFISLENNSTVAYLTTSTYSPTEEFDINPLDETLGIDWKLQLEDFLISEKDRNAPGLHQRRTEGKLPL
jgi:dTDP-4-dehydrorhamnose 3,5-epimerase